MVKEFSLTAYQCIEGSSDSGVRKAICLVDRLGDHA